MSSATRSLAARPGQVARDHEPAGRDRPQCGERSMGGKGVRGGSAIPVQSYSPSTPPILPPRLGVRWAGRPRLSAHGLARRLGRRPGPWWREAVGVPSSPILARARLFGSPGAGAPLPRNPHLHPRAFDRRPSTRVLLGGSWGCCPDALLLRRLRRWRGTLSWSSAPGHRVRSPLALLGGASLVGGQRRLAACSPVPGFRGGSVAARR